MNDDKLMDAAGQLATDIKPRRDLWPDIATAIEHPARARPSWAPYLAQAAVLVLVIGASSFVTYSVVQSDNSPTQIAPPDMLFQEASFGTRFSLGTNFEDARDGLVAELDNELKRMSPQARADVETNLRLIQDAILELNIALDEAPGNIVLQERLLNTYREELALLRHVSGLTRNVMMRNDI